jgi:FKBP-type peptidyl-prolyl cis-trans isomerase
MRNLSRNEWVAVAVAIVFTGYAFFGPAIMSIFKTDTVDQNNQPAAASGGLDKVIISDASVGNGVVAEVGKLLVVHYTLSLSNGTVIQNSKDFGQSMSFILGAGQVIPGWEMGFDGMKVGGVRTIIIPPEYAYGANQVGPIPPNSTLVFTVELIDVQDAPMQTQ